MARYLRDCTAFILNSGDTEQEQIAAFAALQAQSPRKFRDLTDFLFLSPRARALVKPKVFARYLDDTQKMSQDRVTEVLLCGSDNDCRFLLKAAKGFAPFDNKTPAVVFCSVFAASASGV